MSIVLGHTSALAAWRDPEVFRLLEHAPLCVAGSETPTPISATSMRDICMHAPLLQRLERPLHILVPEATARRRVKGVVCHVRPEVFQNAQLYAWTPSILVPTPVHCLMEIGRYATIPQLALLVCEFCGTYARAKNHERGFIDRPPLTSIDALKHEAESLQYAFGRKKLLRALSYSFDNAASPMEAVVGLHLVPPSSQGGFGFPPPLFNWQLDVPCAMRQAAGQAAVKPDMYWPKHNVVVEYDSDQYHLDKDRHAWDSRRRTTLVFTLTRGQLMDLNTMNAFANMLGKALGRTCMPRAANFETKQLHLRAELLDFANAL